MKTYTTDISTIYAPQWRLVANNNEAAIGTGGSIKVSYAAISE